LIAKIVFVYHAMGMISRLPNLTRILFAHREGKPTFDELRTALNGLARRRRKHDMEMIRHYNEAMQKKTSTIAIPPSEIRLSHTPVQ
jgi:hypothetical protein